jgi:integrase
MTCLQGFSEDRTNQNAPPSAHPDIHTSRHPVQSGGLGVDVDALAAALAQRLGASLSQPLDTRTLGEAWSEIDSVLLQRRDVFSRTTRKNTRLAWAHVLRASIDLSVGHVAPCAMKAPTGDAVCVDERLPRRWARARCTADESLGGPLVGLIPLVVRADKGPVRRNRRRPYPRHVLVASVRHPLPRPVSTSPEGDISIAFDERPCLADVRICDLGPRHVTAAWNALAGPSLSTYAASFVARLVEADEVLGFAGLKRWREQWPSVPQPKKRHIEVSDEIHGEAIRCLEWALVDRAVDEQTLRILAVAMHAPGRLDEICALRRVDVDLRAKVLRLEDSKTGAGCVVLTAMAADLLRAQIGSLQWDETWVWPRSNEGGHARADSVSKAWLRLRRAYAAEKKTPEAAALLRWRAHDLGRGALTTQALKNGASIRHVQAALRHKDVRTTELYDHGRSLVGAQQAMELAVKPLKRGGS